ncbi:MAG: SpoIIE family protein phosphatase [Leptonema sp. (in: bacteria)]
MNIFNNLPSVGFELKNPKLRIGAYSTKDKEPFFISELEKNQGLLDNYNSQEWKEITMPFEFKKIQGKEKITAISILYEFEKKDLNFDYQNKEVSLHIPFFTVNSEIFVNGKKLASFGKIDFKEQKYLKVDYRRHAIIKIPSEILKENNEVIVVLYTIYPDNLRLEEITNDIPISISLYSEHLKIHLDTMQFMLLFLYFFVGAYHLLLYIKRPKERYNLWFGLFCIFIAFYYITRSNYVYILASQFNLDSLFITKFEYSILFLASIWGVLFYEEFHYNKITIFAKLISIVVLIYSLSVWFVRYYYATEILGFWQKTALVLIFYSLGIVTYFSFKKNKDSLRLLFGMLIFAITVTLDILGAMEVGVMGLKNLQLTRYGFFIFLIGIAFVLANKFLRVYKEVEDLNLHLEEKVKERTQELKNSLEQIQKLKEQQDGDYFLTSLLIQPLIYINVDSEVVQVEQYIKQKKEFQFRKWQKEIGGDIIIAQSIRLKNKPYVFVFNGDAMGKSLQGAGGSLVAGVIIKAILTRTLLYSENQNKYPEIWLKELFVEIHKVFESFDGSMLISGCLALLDEISGILYYIYAEHPFPVLYRNGKAEFLNTTTEYKKFGTPGLIGKISILLAKLEPNDVIFFGSDGKDDLILSKNGKEYINEDETLFLKIIEESNGNLNTIIDNIKKTGQLMDDISIIKITYKIGEKIQTLKEDHDLQEIKKNIGIYKQEKDLNKLKEYLEEINKTAHNVFWITKELILIYFKLEMYSKVITEAEQYIEVYPHDNEILFLLERAYLYTKNYEKALEIAKRLDLRNPRDPLNLITLTDCYRLLGDKKKAMKSLNRLLDVAPEREETKKLKQFLLNH